MSYDRHWLEEVGSEDSHGRAIWSLGMAVLHPPTDSVLGFCRSLFCRVLPASEALASPRAWSYAILGCLAFLERFEGDGRVWRLYDVLSQRLWKLFLDNASVDWPWMEPVVTYDNGRLVQVLLAAGRAFNNKDMCEQGLNSLEWLLGVQTNRQEGHLSLIGNRGWLKRGAAKAQCDQQPLEVSALIDACYEAYLVTKESKWIERAIWCLDWFLGRNDVHQAVYDSTTHGCRDGLHSEGVSQNQGAESTLAWLMALHRVYEITHEQNSP